MQVRIRPGVRGVLRPPGLKSRLLADANVVNERESSPAVYTGDMRAHACADSDWAGGLGGNGTPECEKHAIRLQG